MRLHDLYYGQSGWIGPGAVTSKYGHKDFTDKVIVTVYQDAFVYPEYSPDHPILVFVNRSLQTILYSWDVTGAMVDYAWELAERRAREADAPEGTRLIVIEGDTGEMIEFRDHEIDKT